MVVLYNLRVEVEERRDGVVMVIQNQNQNRTWGGDKISYYSYVASPMCRVYPLDSLPRWRQHLDNTGEGPANGSPNGLWLDTRLETRECSESNFEIPESRLQQIELFLSVCQAELPRYRVRKNLASVRRGVRPSPKTEPSKTYASLLKLSRNS